MKPIIKKLWASAAIIPLSLGITLTAFSAMEEANAATTYSHTITAKTWSAYGTQALSGVSWTAAATGGAYWAYDATKGQQFGSGSAPAKPLTLSTSGISGSITSIVISTSGASSIAATLGITVGGSAYGGSPKSISATNTAYTFTGNASGAIVLTWTQSSSKAIYLKKIEVVYSSKTLSSLSISGTPSKTTYYAGESFEPAGITVTATYSDSSTANVTSSCTYTPSPLTEGTTSVTVSYTEGVEKTTTVTGITVTTPPWSTAIYTISAKNTFTTTGTTPTGSSAALVETYGTSKQITSGNSQTVTLSSYTSIKISKITLSACSNSSKGAGNLSYSLNGGSSFVDIIPTANFNTSGWYGAWSSTYVDVAKTVDISVSSSIIIKVAATTSSLYVESYDIQWEQMAMPDLSSIAVSGTPSKTTYTAGENFDPTGITVTATYSNSSTANVTSSCTYNPSPLTQGTTSVTVSYTEGSITKTASVSGLTVNAALPSTTVSFGTASEDNNWTESAQNVGSDYIGLATASHYAQTSASTLFGVNAILDSSLIVEFKVGTYGGTPATMPTITVALLDASSNVLSSASGSPTLTGKDESYVQGPTISVTKPANPSSISTIKIYISNVGGMTTSVYMRLEQLKLSFSTIAGITLSSIAVTTQPTNKSYYSGDSLDPSGMVITATYSDSSTANVTSSCTYSPTPLTAGTTSVTATYVEGAITKTTSITGLTVTERALNNISIKTPTSKTSFTLGEPFAYPGLVINANWNSGTVELTSGFTVTGVDTTQLGAQTATITYESKTITYSVNVTNQGARVGDVANISELFISEYYEGSSGNDKYIEIYNGTSSAIDLTTSDYRIKIDANGAGTWAASNIALTGTIPAYGTYVLAHTSANASILALANQTDATVTHNGNDSVGLFKGSTLIDLFGVLGTDPGAAWDIGEVTRATADHTIVRKSSVTAPVTTWNTAEWDVYANTLDYAGSHSSSSADVTYLQQATAFANYVMTGIGLNAQGSCASVLATLVAEYGYMSEDAKLEFETAPEALFVNARARMAYLQAWVAANTPQGLSPVIENSSYSSLIILAASLGFGTMLVYFFTKKKKAI